MSPKGDLIGIAENDGTSCEKKILLSTLSMSGYLTKQTDLGGGRRADLPPLPCCMAIGGYFHYFFKLGSCLGCKGPESKSTALYL